MGNVFEEGRRGKIIVLLAVAVFAVLFLVVSLSISQNGGFSSSAPITGQVINNVGEADAGQENVPNDNTGSVSSNNNQDTPIATQQDNTVAQQPEDNGQSVVQDSNFENVPLDEESSSSGDSSPVGEGSRFGLPQDFGNFGGDTTDWTSYGDLSNVCDGDAVLEIPGVGKIQWDGCVDVRFAKFHKFIRIINGEIFVDSESLHQSFNSSARLTMEGLAFDYTPLVYRNGELCSSSQCQLLDYSNGQAVFTVSSFSSYTLGANSRLDIWDETDPSTFPHAGLTKYPNDNVSFFADYTNLTSGQNITTATCAINFTDSSGFMTYNATKGRYQYTRTFSSAGAFDYNVTCSATGYATLNTSDLVSIQTLNPQQVGPTGANFTVVGSSRGPTSAPDANAAFAGNVTLSTLLGGSITQAWQGYYGNVSGTISLANAAGNVLYNWSATNPSGEVYASRSSGVNFANISCASTSHILNEQNSMGQEASDPDSMQNTFSITTHPQFFTGNTDISANTCNSTNLFNSTGAQSVSFYEVLLSDNSANIVYTAILEQNVLGFDNDLYDFEMIVAEDGHGADTATTSYYFYVELQ